MPGTFRTPHRSYPFLRLGRPIPLRTFPPPIHFSSGRDNIGSHIHHTPTTPHL